MTKERLNFIKEETRWFLANTESILEGNDNYDGADGARHVKKVCDFIDVLIVKKLCDFIDELILELEKKNNELENQSQD